jgi:hypothetical protein
MRFGTVQPGLRQLRASEAHSLASTHASARPHGFLPRVEWGWLRCRDERIDDSNGYVWIGDEL